MNLQNKKKILSNLDMAEFYVQSMDWPVWNKLLKKKCCQKHQVSRNKV